MDQIEKSVGIQQINDDVRLTPNQIEILWEIMVAIEKTWFPSSSDIISIKPQWQEFILISTKEDYSCIFPEFSDNPNINKISKTITLKNMSGEYLNAIKVFETIKNMGINKIKKNLMLRKVSSSSEAVTDFDHAKFYVVNTFIRIYVMLLGFQKFDNSNYRGYMKASRHSDYREKIEGINYEQ